MPNQTAPFDAARVRALVGGTRFADIRYVPETASTNADAQLLLGDATALGATIVAQYQTAGSGRKGRRWFAPAGAALLFTTILPAPLAAGTLWAVPFWIALAVAAGIDECCGVALDLVWPNDLHVAGRKAAGILSVARIAGEDAWVGCGVGINVMRPARDPDLDALVPQPIFLDDLTPSPQREHVLAAVLRNFDRSFDDLGDTAGIVARWETRAALLGTIYRYRRDDDEIDREAVAQRIGPHGELVVRDADVERTIDMADVRVVGRLPAQQQARFH